MNSGAAPSQHEAERRAKTLMSQGYSWSQAVEEATKAPLPATPTTMPTDAAATRSAMRTPESSAARRNAGLRLNWNAPFRTPELGPSASVAKPTTYEDDWEGDDEEDDVTMVSITGRSIASGGKMPARPNPKIPLRDDDQRIANAPNLPRHPVFHGSTLYERWQHAERYRNYVRELSNYESSTTKPFQMPISGTVAETARQIIAFYYFKKPADKITEQEWIQFFEEAYSLDVADYNAVDAAMKRLKMDVTQRDAFSRVHKLVHEMHAVLREHYVEKLMADEEKPRLVKYLVEALEPADFRDKIRDRLTQDRNKRYRKDVVLFVDWLVGQLRSWIEWEPVHKGDSKPTTKPGQTGRRGAPAPTTPVSGTKGAKPAGGDAGGAGSSRGASSGGQGGGKARFPCLKCQSLDHSVRQHPQIHPEEARRLIAEWKAQRSASKVARVRTQCTGVPSSAKRGEDDGLAAGATPKLNFATATVCCIPKTSTPSTGLDFRPIALLNSDYKIYSRLLLTRVKDSLARTLSPTQFGFAPGKQVHDAIDLWTAIQRLVHDGLAPATTTAVLLDFAKAYDTLDRQFLHAALERHGFGDDFVHAVFDMHLVTTAKFLADGDLSPAVDIHNGIRQGCPLAPVLFVLAIDQLYQAADTDPALAGVRLNNEVCVKLGGYADDTTSFLSHPAEEPALLQLLDDFGAASGLRVNASKCAAICLSRDGPTADHAGMSLPVMAVDRHCRLLGVHVASAPSAAHVWALTMQQQRATLHLAATKTTDVLQRVAISKAVVMPKIAFIGRHVWPNGDVIDSLQRFIHNYVWTGTLAAASKSKRAWLSADIAVLPPRDGGVGMPCVREAFLRLSEKTTTRWATATSPTSAAIGHILLRQPPTSASHRTARLVRLVTPTPRLEATMAATGLARTRSRLALPRHADEESLVRKLVRGVGRRSHQTWDQGWLHCRYDANTPVLDALFRVQRDRYGSFSIASLLAAPVIGAGMLLAPNGKDVRHQDCPALLAHGPLVGDVLSLDWCGGYYARFFCKVEAFPLSPRTAIQFRRLCDLLVYNYPAVLRPLNPEHVLQPRPPTLDRWLLESEHLGLRLWLDHGGGHRVDLGIVASRADATKRAREAGQAVVTFVPHPWLDPYAQLWHLVAQSPSPAVARAAVHSTAISRVREREALACLVDADLGKDVQRLSWARLARLKHCVSSQRRLLLQIRGARLSGWTRSLNARGCPHCVTTGAAGGHTFHIVWYCPCAQALWTLLLQFWRHLGVWRSGTTADSSAFRRAVFSLRLPSTPIGATTFIASCQEPAASSALHDLMEDVWIRHVIACFQTIWQWRQCTADTDAPWSYPVARSAPHGKLQASLASAADGIHAGVPAARELCHLLAACRHFISAPPPLHHPPPPMGEYVLFFDGGSRGNPGPGGAGAIVISVDKHCATSTLVWSAAMSLASPRITNNQAEYLGLVTGLAAADRHRWRPLSVVGDSQLIINQLRQYRPPKNNVLRRFYHSARRLADGLGVARWSHHLRAFNKAADAAANIAMDTHRSIQTHHPTARPEWAGLDQLSAGDFLHWQASILGDH